MRITSAPVRRPEPGRAPARSLVALWVTALAVLGAGSWVPAWSGDEAATIMVVRRSLTEVLGTGPYDPALRPYYLLVNLWAVPSTAPGWMRLSSVLAMATAVTLTAALASRLVARTAAVPAAVVMLALPAVSRYAHDVRPYAWSVLLTVAVVWCWTVGLGRWSRRIAFTVLVVALGLVQPYALLLVPVLVVASIAAAVAAPEHDRHRADLPALLGCSAIALVTVSPFLLQVARRAVGQIDPPPLSVTNLLQEVLRLPVALLTPPLAALCALLVLLATGVGTVLAWRAPAGRRLAALVTPWLLLPPAALCLLQVLGGGPGLVARYWTFCLPAIVLASTFVLAALWAVRPWVAVSILVLVVVTSLPTQWRVRTTDGHLGQRWRDMPAALDHPVLADVPLLVEGWSYRALVSNDPLLARRMLLVVDPRPEGRINPRTYGPGSPPFARLLVEHGRVVVLQGEQGYSDEIPRRRAFTDFRPELEPYPLLPVRCAYFGEPLGVFTTAESALTPAEAEQVAAHISSVSPHRIRCAVSSG